jgi:DNA replication protein DnaC
MKRISEIKYLAPISKVPQKSITWECIKGESGIYKDLPFIYQGCGIILPVESNIGTRYRNACACEKAAKKKYAFLQEQKELFEKHIKMTYQWAGEESDIALAAKSFENYETCYVTEEGETNLYDVYQTVRSFADLLEGSLIIYGSYGLGKTYLLAALCNYLREGLVKPIDTRFIPAIKLFAAIEEQIGNKRSFNDIIRKAVSTRLLVIDDVDKLELTTFRSITYLRIIDERVNANLPTAISLNSINSFHNLADHVGAGAASRLQIGQIEMEMLGEDYRKKLK